jgi:RNA polymerase-binding protein DksA
MKTMTKSHLQSFRSALLAQIESHTEELTRLSQHANDPEHSGIDRFTATALLDSTRQSLADANEALKRMAEGTYGVCETCGDTIPLERLEILPHARLCVPCQQNRRA